MDHNQQHRAGLMLAAYQYKRWNMLQTLLRTRGIFVPTDMLNLAARDGNLKVRKDVPTDHSAYDKIFYWSDRYLQ